jgi:hypothetical protein
MVWDLGFRIIGLGFRVKGLGFVTKSLGAQDLRFREIIFLGLRV